MKIFVICLLNAAAFSFLLAAFLTHNVRYPVSSTILVFAPLSIMANIVIERNFQLINSRFYAIVLSITGPLTLVSACTGLGMAAKGRLPGILVPFFFVQICALIYVFRMAIRARRAGGPPTI